MWNIIRIWEHELKDDFEKTMQKVITQHELNANYIHRKIQENT